MRAFKGTWCQTSGFGFIRFCIMHMYTSRQSKIRQKKKKNLSCDQLASKCLNMVTTAGSKGNDSPLFFRARLIHPRCPGALISSISPFLNYTKCHGVFVILFVSIFHFFYFCQTFLFLALRLSEETESIFKSFLLGPVEIWTICGGSDSVVEIYPSVLP